MKGNPGGRGVRQILAGGACLLAFSGAAPTGEAPFPALNGLWLTDGYGYMVAIQGDTMRTYELTNQSCLAGDELKRDPSTAPGDVLFGDGAEVFRLRPANSQDTLWLHAEGTVSSIFMRRVGTAPETCGRTTPDTPPLNYSILWETFAEHYPFFAARGVDWAAVDTKYRPQVRDDTKPDDLYRMFREMIEPLHDAHTGLRATSLSQGFHGYRPAPELMGERRAGIIRWVIQNRYVVGSLQTFCNGKLQFGLLRGNVGYMRIHSFSRYADGGFSNELAALEGALDQIFGSASNLSGLVIDVRINTGGWDSLGIALASRLTADPYLAYSKVIRNDIADPDGRTPPQDVMVPVSTRPGFRGRVILLTGADSISASETFTLALMDRKPNITRIGGATQGVFSNVLTRRLPNGWGFALPNEIYLTKDGKSFDVTGIPPTFETPVFTLEDLGAGRDSALDRALTLFATKPEGADPSPSPQANRPAS